MMININIYCFKLSDVVFVMLINVKMSKTVGLLIFMSMINFMLSQVEHEKQFITSGAGHVQLGHILICCVFLIRWLHKPDDLDQHRLP